MRAVILFRSRQNSICKKNPPNQWKNILQLGKILEVFMENPTHSKETLHVKEIQITFSLSQKFDYYHKQKVATYPNTPRIPTFDNKV